MKNKIYEKKYSEQKYIIHKLYDKSMKMKG